MTRYPLQAPETLLFNLNLLKPEGTPDPQFMKPIKTLYGILVLSLFLPAFLHGQDLSALSVDVDTGIEIELGEPVVIAQAPPELTKWGPYQVCDVEKLPNGVIRAGWHVGDDSPTDYVRIRRMHAISKDQGKTWDISEDPFSGITINNIPVESPIEEQDTFGWLLGNGDRLEGYSRPTQPVDSLTTGSPLVPFVKWTNSYGQTYDLYKDSDLSEKYKQWKMRRLKAGQAKWETEQPVVNIPGELRHAIGGHLYFTSADISGAWTKQLYPAPDGSIWIAIPGQRIENEKAWANLGILFLRSTDQGKTWDLAGQIPYSLIHEGEAVPVVRDGFSEPALTFNKDGSMLVVMRTCDVTAEDRPMYYSRSTDNGKTWSAPKVFDTFGIWPTFVRLKNGVTLLSYGRPGVFIRGSADPAGLKWTDKFTILDSQNNSDCNVGMAAIDDDTAIIVYSSFNHPVDSGNSSSETTKTILARTISVRSSSKK